jgi:hypothetical protein
MPESDTDYSAYTGDPDDKTLNELEDRLGDEVTKSDIDDIVEEVTVEWERYVYLAKHGPDSDIARRKRGRKLMIEYAKRRDSIKRRLDYYLSVQAAYAAEE